MKLRDEREGRWTKWFAWFPVVTTKGDWLWFSWAYRRWVVECGDHWGYDGYSGRDDGFQYREVAVQ